jgi:hypothetical protein
MFDSASFDVVLTKPGIPANVQNGLSRPERVLYLTLEPMFVLIDIELTHHSTAWRRTS